jgi:hypothetical protein
VRLRKQLADDGEFNGRGLAGRQHGQRRTGLGRDGRRDRALGVPVSSLSDNGSIYTNKHRPRHDEAAFEKNLRALGRRIIAAAPYHPTTCGKIERFWQTMKKWLRAHGPYDTVADLKRELDRFVEHYNGEAAAPCPAPTDTGGRLRRHTPSPTRESTVAGTTSCPPRHRDHRRHDRGRRLQVRRRPPLERPARHCDQGRRPHRRLRRQPDRPRPGRR